MKTAQQRIEHLIRVFKERQEIEKVYKKKPTITQIAPVKQPIAETSETYNSQASFDTNITNHQIDVKLVLDENLTPKERRKVVEKWLRENLQGKTITSVDGKRIYFNRALSVEHLAHDSRASYLDAKAVTHIIEVLTQGKFIEKQSLYKERNDGIIAFHVYQKWVNIDNYSVLLQVKAGEFNDGRIAVFGDLVAYAKKIIKQGITPNDNQLLDGVLTMSKEFIPVQENNSIIFDSVQHKAECALLILQVLDENGQDITQQILDENKPYSSLMTGRSNKVKTAKGTKLDTVFAIVEIDDVIASHTETGAENPQYPQVLQPRDRSRESSQAWVQKTANSLDPESLGRTGRADTGSPIVGDDLVVESGNGRTMAIKLAYKNGKADEYKQWLIDEAEYFGFDSEQVEQFKQPILIRIRQTEIDRVRFAMEANQDDKLSYTATERAKSDSKRITQEMLHLFEPSDDGDLLAMSNRKFISAFLATLGDTESAQYIDKDGRPTQALITRIKAGLFAKAYNDDRLLEMMADHSKPELQNMLNALSLAVPKFIEAQAVNKGHTQEVAESIIDSIEQSINDQVKNAIVDATNMIISAKRNNQAIHEYVQQQGLFDDIDENIAKLAIFIATNQRSAKKMATLFKAMAEKIELYAIDSQTMGLFGDPEPINLEDVVNYAFDVFDKNYADNSMTLFDSAKQGEDNMGDIESKKQRIQNLIQRFKQLDNPDLVFLLDVAKQRLDNMRKHDVGERLKQIVAQDNPMLNPYIPNAILGYRQALAQVVAKLEDNIGDSQLENNMISSHSPKNQIKVPDIYKGASFETTNTISFNEYLEDFLDLHIGLMGREELAEARLSYNKFIEEAKNKKTPKQQKDEWFFAEKDNKQAMLEYHGITEDVFEQITLEQLASIRTSKDSVGYKDPKRQLWHDYRVALTQKIREHFKTTRVKKTANGELSGTPKQVKWAKSLRDRFVQQVTGDIATLARTASVAQKATFWINHRDSSIAEITAKLSRKTR